VSPINFNKSKEAFVIQLAEGPCGVLSVVTGGRPLCDHVWWTWQGSIGPVGTAVTSVLHKDPVRTAQ